MQYLLPLLVGALVALPLLLATSTWSRSALDYLLPFLVGAGWAVLVGLVLVW